MPFYLLFRHLSMNQKGGFRLIFREQILVNHFDTISTGESSVLHGVLFFSDGSHDVI